MMVKKTTILLATLLLSTFGVRGQREPSPSEFISPMEIPILLSANCGELRSNHFHSGLDIKTQGVINKPVYAVAGGYVSRVMVSPWGFGKALYIQHPNGTTSVYAHVESFYAALNNYVYEQQYNRKSFSVDLTLSPDQFPISQGELVALSGNRGSSGGPHLHFEIRDGAQRPYNILAREFMSVTDTIPPTIQALYYVSVESVDGNPYHRVRERIPVKRISKTHYALSTPREVRVGDRGYFAIEAIEYKNGTTNVMGLYRIEERIDGSPIISLEIDRIPFDLTRYVNASTLYSQESRNHIYTLYVLPNNPLPIYGNLVNRGMISLSNAQRREMEILLTDESGNQSTLKFSILHDPAQVPSTRPEGEVAIWSQDYNYHQMGLKVEIPAKSLYETAFLRIKKREVPNPSYAYSALYDIHTSDEPLQNYITISLPADSLPAALRSKALLGSVSAGGKRSDAEGAWRATPTGGGEVSARVRNFGTYYIAVDTIAPRITAGFQNGASLSGKSSLSFTVTDDFSGVDTFSTSIDGKWALLEYDPKNNLLTHIFDNTRWPATGKKHDITLTVTDDKGNSSTFIGHYIR